MRKMVLPALVISVLLPTVPAFGGWGFCGKPSRETTQETRKKQKNPSRLRRWLGCTTPQDASVITSAGSSLSQSKPPAPTTSRVKKVKPEQTERAESILVAIPGPPPDDFSTTGLPGTRPCSTHLEEPHPVQSICSGEEVGDTSLDDPLEELREKLQQEIAEKTALEELIPATDPKHQEVEQELQQLRSHEHELESAAPAPHGGVRPWGVAGLYSVEV